MRKFELTIFYPDDEEKQRNPILYKDAACSAFTFDHILKADELDSRYGLIILWDSTREERGEAKLEEIRRTFPDVPLLLLAANPSRRYLMAAIRHHVHQVLALPPGSKEFREAIDSALQSRKKTGSFEEFGNWLQDIRQSAQSWTKIFTTTPREQGDLNTLEVLGIAPPSLQSLLNPKLEQEKTHDVQVQFLGNLTIRVKGKPVPETIGKKNAAVLAYLLFHHDKSLHKDVLMDKFWKDVPPASARNSLHVAICSIRKTLTQACPAREVILYNSESYCINPELEVVTDVDKFIYFWKKARTIESAQGLDDALGAYHKAISYYKDEFLTNIRFDEWCETERDNLREIYLFILNRLSDYAFQHKNYDACINICRKMLDKDDCLEEIHRKLMVCYHALGLADLALRQFYKCEKALEKELGLKPAEPTHELFQKIQNGKSLVAG